MPRTGSSPIAPRWLAVPLAAILVAFVSPVADASDLTERVGAALRHPALRHGAVGVLVVRADNGQTLFERLPDTMFVPASNLKILTAVAALASFGPTHRFTTRVYTDTGPDHAGTVGTLAVRGGGDPALTSEDWWRLAGAVRRQGVQRVRGDLLVDDSHFDRQRWNPAWGAISDGAYHAPVGALAANYSSFIVHMRAGIEPHQPLRISVEPRVPYLRLANHADTGARTDPRTLRVHRHVDTDIEEVRVSGALPVGSNPAVFHRSVANPVAYAGAVFRMQLAAHGIGVEGVIRSGVTPNDYRELLAFEGKPLSDIVRLFMKHSNNNIAECLVKAMGVETHGESGSWQNGLRAMREQLVSLGLDPRGFTLADGSGLARTNRVSPRTLVNALRIGRGSFQFGPEFSASLPIAGRDGTLAGRAPAAIDAVRAKTGLLHGAAGLSGYAASQDGVELVFSILANDYRASGAEVMAAIDGVANALTNSTVASEVSQK